MNEDNIKIIDNVKEDHKNDSDKVTLQDITNQIVEEMVLNLNKKVIKKDVVSNLKKHY